MDQLYIKLGVCAWRMEPRSYGRISTLKGNSIGCTLGVHLKRSKRDLSRVQARKYGGSSPNSLRLISYIGSIWELYVSDLKTNIFCRKKIQLHFPMNKGLTEPKQCQQFGWKQPKCTPKFQPNLSAQAQKFRIFENRTLSGCPLSVITWKFLVNNVFHDFHCFYFCLFLNKFGVHEIMCAASKLGRCRRQPAICLQ